MEAAADPHESLLRILKRYRSDVHYLRPPASEQAIPTAQAHVGVLPATLRAFLERWNGATLFRGALRVRGLSELSAADPAHPGVVLFADGPRESDRWGYVSVARGHHFGRWDGQTLLPLHEDFNSWLTAQSRLLDEDCRDDAPIEPRLVGEPRRATALDIRLAVDPYCGLLHLAMGERLLAEGDGDGALKCFRRASALAPELPAAWQRLGEAQLSVSRGDAMQALLMAFRGVSLPLPYPGYPSIDRSLLKLMEHQFPTGDLGWERELTLFLEERTRDLRDDGSLEWLVEAAMARTRLRLCRHERVSARDGLRSVRSRVRTATTTLDAPVLTLALADLEVDLGNHDEAEELLRELRDHPNKSVRGRAGLVLARVTLQREEPWFDEIVREALDLLVDPEDRVEGLLLLAERGDEAARNECERLLAGLDQPKLHARFQLVAGDAARERGDARGAVAAWQGTSADTESAMRAQMRLGDLSVDPARAMQHFRTAAEGHAELQLPLREAWARLRLGARGDEDQLEAALSVFWATGLAAGVAAAHTLRGAPDLDWHLKLSAEYARQRYDAQRLRPPLTRADADRPERRLLAHRRAIAACDARVADVIAEELLSDLRQVQMSDSRVFSPLVTRFVALVDLLAGHPSYESARHLLELLKLDITHEMASRAVLGAVARSPNMSLVASMLEGLGTWTEPQALMRVIEVLGFRRELEAVPRLLELLAQGSFPVRRAAITALGRIGDARSVSAILPSLDEPDLAEAAAIALLLLGEWRGVDFHGQALAKELPNINSSPGEIVGRFGGPSYLLLLMRVADRDGAAGVGALDGLGWLGSTRAVPKLIDAVGARDPLRQAAASRALIRITGHFEEVEAPHPRARWEAWWSSNGDKHGEGQRWRAGKTMGIRLLIETLGHDDPGARQGAFDELVIATGERLPFDADGPYRMQLAHRRAWARWYADHNHELPTGGWMFHGNSVG